MECPAFAYAIPETVAQAVEILASDDGARPLAGGQSLLPTAVDVPDIEIAHLETPSNLVPRGIKGMGESAIISASAAAIGAVNDALSCFGVFITQYPVSPSRVVSALGAAVQGIAKDLGT